MKDDEFLAELEACRLPERLFDHAAHVRLGYLYLRRQSFPQALASMSTAITNYAKAIGKGSLYHETITVAFMALIQQGRGRGGDHGGWEGFKARNPELLRKEALLEYYPKELLDSGEARSRFVLMPLASGRPSK